MKTQNNEPTRVKSNPPEITPTIMYVNAEALKKKEPQRIATPKPKKTPPKKAKLDVEALKLFSSQTMSIEDKIAALLIKVMDQMDKDIEAQISKVDKLQNDNAKAKKSKKEDDTTSIDHEMFKLDRLTDKREQMFSMLTGIVKRYTQSAQNVLRDLGQ